MGASARQGVRILRLLPRIAAEVLARAELLGIDEDADHHLVGAVERHPDQRAVTGVQPAPGRHQGDAPPPATPVPATAPPPPHRATAPTPSRPNPPHAAQRTSLPPRLPTP